jgi:hypothetical protein
VRSDAGYFREEPGAGNPHARIREGEAEWPSYSTTTPAGRQPVDRAQLESSIAAAIYAAAGLVFDYAHRRIDHHLPGLLTWDDVRVALDSMRIFEDEFPRLHDLVRRRESVSGGPFEAG